MRVELWVEIKGKIDSKALYDIIGHQGMNVTELDDKTLVYGECYILTASQVIYHCSLFGETVSTIKHRG